MFNFISNNEGSFFYYIRSKTAELYGKFPFANFWSMNRGFHETVSFLFSFIVRDFFVALTRSIFLLNVIDSKAMRSLINYLANCWSHWNATTGHLIDEAYFCEGGWLSHTIKAGRNPALMPILAGDHMTK